MGLALSGCGDFFERKPTELESRAVLRDIARIRENPHVSNPLPAIYTDGPKRLKVEDGVKLFYFTKYMPVGDLTFSHKDANLQREVHGYAGTIRDMGFKVSSNPDTNQLIIHCANDEECDQVLTYLKRTDVPPIQVHIDCLILERFGDVTKDWETSLLIENLFGEGITLGEDKWPNPAFPGASLRESKRSEFGLDFGYWTGKAGHLVRATVDILESRGYLKVLMNPTLETVNGKVARVQIRDNAPIERIVTQNGGSYSVTDYQWVADTLTVVPYVYADGSIGLKTQITIGSKSKPEGVIQTSIITERSVDIGENRIQPGKSLTIGGMRKSENRSVVRGIPFLKDIPILGILFSSKDFEEKATEIIFVLTPSISSGGVPYDQMASTLRAKYATPNEESGLHDLLADPLGSEAYSDLVEEKTQTAEAEKVRLNRQTNAARRQAYRYRLRAEKASLEARGLKAKAEQLQRQIEETAARKQAAEAEAVAAEKEQQLRNAQLNQAAADITTLQQEAAAAQEQAQRARQALEEAQRKAQEAQQQVQAAAEAAAALDREIEAMEQAEAAEAAQAAEAAAEAAEAAKAAEANAAPAEASTANGQAEPPAEAPAAGQEAGQ